MREQAALKSHLAVVAVPAGVVWVMLGLWFRAKYVLTGCTYSESGGVIDHGIQTRGGWPLLAYAIATISLLTLVLCNPPDLLDHDRRVLTVVKVALIAGAVVVASTLTKCSEWNRTCSSM